MTKYYFEGHKLRDICLNEGVDYEKVRQCAYRGTDLEKVIRLPVTTHKGLFYGKALYHCPCPDCVFMGHTEGHDLYYCNGSHGLQPGTWIIARFGDGVWDETVCREGMAYKNILMIAESLYRAIAEDV